ncbi:hypothetical protein Dimus_024108, partial [Dionaea muscipula]
MAEARRGLVTADATKKRKMSEKGVLYMELQCLCCQRYTSRPCRSTNGVHYTTNGPGTCKKCYLKARDRQRSWKEKRKNWKEKTKNWEEKMQNWEEKRKNWEENEELGRENAELGREKEELGRENEELGREKKELERKNEELGRENKELGRENEEVKANVDFLRHSLPSSHDDTIQYYPRSSPLSSDVTLVASDDSPDSPVPANKFVL